MTDFARARKNMVDTQIHVSGVITPEILHSFEKVPREEFVPKKLASVAYNDEDLIVPDGRFLLEPLTHARMLEAAKPDRKDVVLDIGGYTGYAASILSPLVMTVIAVEEDAAALSQAEKIWTQYGFCNIAGFKGKLAEGYKKGAPYDLILVNGSVAEIPLTLVEQLSDTGRMILILREADAPVGRVMKVSKTRTVYSAVTLFDASCPYLRGFEPQPAFHF